ncbi:MAG TPA: haloacid dehalogenase type II [Polyangiaceae bacterium]|jgi:2-haloacid dehalogenase|nr:haloacid dehalogenase type II [Polyangiaceae bacterium]
MSRRRFLSLAVQGAGSLVAASCAPEARVVPAGPNQGRVAAVAFDLYTLFDPRGVDRQIEALLGPTPLGATWKTRLFEYCWLRAAAGRYLDFERLAHDALEFAAGVHGLELDAAHRERLVTSLSELSPWPDTEDTLRALAAHGLRLAPLANYSPRMIDHLLGHAGLRAWFETPISTDRARTYKPDPRAYALGEAQFGLPRHRIAFAAFGGWDAAGASWFGFPSFWVNRLAVSPDELGARVATGPDLRAFAHWVTNGS